MSNWRVNLDGHPFDLADLVTLGDYFSDEELSVQQDGARFWFTSAELASLPDYSAVHKRATELLELLNGVGAALLGTRPVAIDSISEFSADGIEHIHKSVAATLGVRTRLTAKATVIGDDGSVVPAEAQSRSRLMPALQDEKVRSALRIYGSQERNWVNLVKVFELVESDVGSGMYARDWISKAKADLLNRTANSRAAIGDEARHGHRRVPAPPNPMTIAEARELIRGLLEKWLRWKAEGPGET